MLTSIRHPRRRAVSVGPQSEADAYETLAYRQKRRTESNASDRNRSPNGVRLSPPAGGSQQLSNNRTKDKLAKSPTRGLREYEHMMGTGTPVYEKDVNPTDLRPGLVVTEDGSKEQDEQDMFSMITKPRVRYDVEVVTKLIVYSGMSSLLYSLSLVPCFWLTNRASKGSDG